MENKKKIAEHKRRNSEMFNAIARRYDLLNHLLSGGVDIYWRRRALECVRTKRPGRILDLATGTGDFALAAERLGPQQVVGVDMAIEMLRLGADKIADRRPPISLGLLVGDAERLPFQEETFDLVMGAFGVRNFGDIPSGLSEAYRVLKPGGEILVLDFCQPGERQAYAYLPRAVGEFPQGSAFVELLSAAGFIDASFTYLTLGISAVYRGVKRPVD